MLPINMTPIPTYELWRAECTESLRPATEKELEKSPFDIEVAAAPLIEPSSHILIRSSDIAALAYKLKFGTNVAEHLRAINFNQKNVLLVARTRFNNRDLLGIDYQPLTGAIKVIEYSLNDRFLDKDIVYTVNDQIDYNLTRQNRMAPIREFLILVFSKTLHDVTKNMTRLSIGNIKELKSNPFFLSRPQRSELPLEFYVLAQQRGEAIPAYLQDPKYREEVAFLKNFGEFESKIRGTLIA